MDKVVRIGPTSSSSRILIASSVVLFSSLLVARFTYFQAILVAPAFLALFFCTAVYLVIAKLLRGDSQPLRKSRNAIRPLVFATPSAWSAVLTRDKWENETTVSEGPYLLLSAPVAIRAGLDRLLDLIQRHFILPWYSRISPSPAFPRGTNVLIRHAIANAITQGNQVDWPSLLVSRLVPIIKDHLQHYRTVESLASTSTNSRTALPLPLPTTPHPALSAQDYSNGTSPLIEAHLRTQTDLLLRQILPDADKSEVVSLLVREILLGAVLLPVFEMLCEPDFWNRQIEEHGGRYLDEQYRVNKFLSTLSRISDTPTVTPVKAKWKATSPPASISADSTSQEFDAFLGSISNLNTMGDARRLRSEVERDKRLAQINVIAEEQRAASDAIGREGERWVKKSKKFVQRLARASLQLDTRIIALSGLSKSPELLRSPQTIQQNLFPGDISLQRVLQDPSSLAYWLEFMERRGRSKLVQFWLTLEGFRDEDPLGTVESSPIDLAVTDSSELLGDVTSLYQTYFGAGSEMGVSSRDAGVIRDFVMAQSPVTAEAVRLVRRSIFAAQNAVFEQMAEEDWEEFKRNDLYRKAVQDLARQNSLPSMSTFSPRSVTSPMFTPIPPSKPIRHVSSPLLEKRPNTKIGPTLVNGNFTPTTVTPSASLSTSPPTFPRSMTQARPVSSSYVTRPVTPPRRPSHLDILFTGGANSPTDAEGDRRIFSEEEDNRDDDFIQAQTAEAIQAALDDLIADDMSTSRMNTVSPPDSTIPSMSNSLVLPPTQNSESNAGRLVSRSVENLRSASTSRPPFSPPSHTPSNSGSSGRPAMTRRRSTSKMDSSHRDQLFEDSIDVPEADDSFRESSGSEYVQLAAAGNLHLGPEIARLELRIQELLKQEKLLEGYTRRAELEGRQGEVKWLNRSISKVKRDIRSSLFQKDRYEQQKEANRLVPGRTQVSVPSAHIVPDASEGKQVARYAVRVNQNGEDGQPGANWVVYRRYNQFFELDRAIRDWAAQSSNTGLRRDVKDLVELPGKTLLPSTSSGLMEARRHGLERYLKCLISSASICDSAILRDFLSRSSPPTNQMRAASNVPQKIVPSLFTSVAESLDEMGPSMLDTIQSALNRQINDVADGIGEVADLGGDLIGQGLASFIPPIFKMGALSGNPEPVGSAKPKLTEVKVETANMGFTAPISDLFMEIFGLDKSTWWRRAVVGALQQILGSTIERKVKDTLRVLVEPDSLERLLSGFSDTLFPNGERRPPSDERSEKEKRVTQYRASETLLALIPGGFCTLDTIQS